MQIVGSVDAAAARPQLRPNDQQVRSDQLLVRSVEVAPSAQDVPTVDAPVGGDSFVSNSLGRSAPGPSPQERSGLADLAAHVRSLAGGAAGMPSGWVAELAAGGRGVIGGQQPVVQLSATNAERPAGRAAERAGVGDGEPLVRSQAVGSVVPAHRMVAVARVLFTE